MEFLDDVESLELFGSYAFHEELPTEDFEEVALQVVQYVKGHPLALKVLGSFLYGKTVQEWKSELDGLQVYPNEEIHRVLRLSFDALSPEQKNIFLDIACSFIGENKDFVATILDSCNYFADTNIRVLVDKSLITISRSESLEMHDLIQRMAKEIMREESNVPGNCIRLWIPSDDCDGLTENKATKAVQVLNLFLAESSQNVHIDVKAFSHMKILRILKICDRELEDFRRPFELRLWKNSKVNYSGRLQFLSNKLRLLYWHGYPFKFFPSDFYPENIVAIDLSYSHIKNLWTSPKCFTRLKVMKLKHCRNLTSTPDFTRITNLEELILEGCVNLVKVHPSFGMLRKLVVLNMRDCKRFRRFPCKVEMDSLEVVNLSGCSKLDKLPEFFVTNQTLREFCVDGTAITELPSFVLSQCNLQVLEFGRREKKRSGWWTCISQPSWLASKMQHPQSLVMPSLAGLCSLKRLNLSHCNISEVSDSIRGLSCLQSLYLDGNKFTSFPTGCLSRLSHLAFLNIPGCKKLEVLPELPPNLNYLDASNCTSLHELHGPFSYNNQLAMYFEGCPKLFKNVSIESQVCMSQPLPDLNSSITSHTLRNQISSFLQVMEFPNSTCGIFGEQFSYLGLDIIYHGNIIPQWFTNRSTGNHIKVELPPNFCYNKVRGYGICVVFKPKDSYGCKSCHNPQWYYVDNFDGTSLQQHHELSYGYIGIPKSDIISFRFMNTRNWVWVEANNFVTFSFKKNDEFELKACGVRLVFDEDIQGEETGLNIPQDLPTPTQDGGYIKIGKGARVTSWCHGR